MARPPSYVTKKEFEAYKKRNDNVIMKILKLLAKKMKFKS